MGVLNNVTTANAYTDGNTLTVSPPAPQATVLVANGAVYVQFALTEPGTVRHPEAFTWEFAERFLVPSAWQFTEADFGGRRITGVRVRSAKPGTPAQVTISA